MLINLWILLFSVRFAELIIAIPSSHSFDAIKVVVHSEPMYTDSTSLYTQISRIFIYFWYSNIFRLFVSRSHWFNLVLSLYLFGHIAISCCIIKSNRAFYTHLDNLGCDGKRHKKQPINKIDRPLRPNRIELIFAFDVSICESQFASSFHLSPTVLTFIEILNFPLRFRKWFHQST